MIKLGLVGCAHCHTPWIAGVLKNRKDAIVKTVYDHDAERAGRIARVLDCPVVPDSGKIWDDPEIDGALILTETDRHKIEVPKGVARRKPVFVEKPLGVNAAEANRMAKMIEAAGIPFMMGYRTRSEGLFIFLRDQIGKGNFGVVTRIRYINCHDGALAGGFADEHRWMVDPRQAGGGVFLDLGTHALDSLLWLMNDEVVAATSVTGRAPSVPGVRDCEDFGEGLIRFKSGAIGSLAAGWVDVDQPVRCVVSGTKGHAHVTDGKLYYKSGIVAGADGKSPWTDLPPDRPLVFDHFVDALAGKAFFDLVTPAEAARVCAVQEALRIGAEKGKWVGIRGFGRR